MQSRFGVACNLLALLATAAVGGCAPLSHSIISLDGSDTGNLASVAMLDVDSLHPLLIRGLDGNLLNAVRVPSAFRTWSFVMSPGKHLLWVSNVPYGHPLLPQIIRCFAIDAPLEAGVRYVLRYDPAGEQALLVRRNASEPVASGRLVDKPLMLERNCRWN